MLKIFILEDERIQQSRIEKVIKELISRKSLSCKAPEIFGNAGQLLNAITERGSHQLFFLDIEIEERKRRGWILRKKFEAEIPMPLLYL